MFINTCCGCETDYPTELCPECYEHCDWENLDEEDNLEQNKTNQNDSN